MRMLAGLQSARLLVPIFHRQLSWAAMASANRHATSPIEPRADELLRFWFGDDYQRVPATDTAAARARSWFGGGEAFDQECKAFESDVEAAAKGRLASWTSGYNALAAVILQDQITRNIYRGSAKSFALDGQALQLAKQVHDSGSLSGIPAIQRSFLYLPLMHSEQLADLELCVRRFQELKEEAQQLPGGEALVQSLQNNCDYAAAHRRVIEQWGRYPHRNKILGRPNTPEEEAAFAAGKIPSF